MRDSRAADGIFSDGNRLVREGGRVKVAGMWFSSPNLLPFVGKTVFVANFDYWLTEGDAYHVMGHVFITKMKVEELPDEQIKQRIKELRATHLTDKGSLRGSRSVVRSARRRGRNLGDK